MKIRNAVIRDYERIRDFYYQVTDEMENSPFPPGWEKDVYPSQKSIKDAIKNDEMYILTENDIVVGAMIVNWESNEGYKQAKWTSDVKDGEYMTVHALGVLPAYSNKGYGRKLAEKAKKIGVEKGRKAVRLDVLVGNTPAEKLYPSRGFRYIDTLNMYYEDTGWTDFMLFEYYIG